MFCVDSIIKTPEVAALTAGIVTIFLFYLSFLSGKLPFALIIGAAVAYFIYTMMGGSILCVDGPKITTKTKSR
jgi:hypothetical protein